MSIHTLHNLLKQKILVLDGATGTMIQKLGLSEDEYRGIRFSDHSFQLTGHYDVLVLTQPHIMKDLHRQYLEAGADIITTNTFNANRVTLADFGMQNEAKAINYSSATTAKELAEHFSSAYPSKPRFVAGSIGPTHKRISLPNDKHNRMITFDHMVEVYYEQISALIEGGVDILLLETVHDIQIARAAVQAIEDYCLTNHTEIPVMISATLTEYNRNDVVGFLSTVNCKGLLSVGFNCVDGRRIKPYLFELSEKIPHYISLCPYAGLPGTNNLYSITPDEFAGLINEYLNHGAVNLVGGCCGTTPQHIKKLVEIVGNSPPGRSKR